MEPIFCVRRYIERFKEKKRNSAIVFIDSKKDMYDRVPSIVDKI